MSYYADLQDQIDGIVSEYVEKCTRVNADDCGLDPRAGTEIFIGPKHDVLIVNRNRVRSLNYYGGFEYIDSECVRSMSDFVFFTADDKRVVEAIDNALESGKLEG